MTASPEHPRFEEAVELIRNNGNLEIASDETFREAYGLFDLIATETARAYALEQGLGGFGEWRSHFAS